MEDAELARLDIPALLSHGVAGRGKELFGNGAVAAAITLDNAGVIPRSLVFLAEIVRSGGAKYASELTEPLPTPEQTAVIHPWLAAAASASSSVDDDYTVEDWLKAVAAILATRRAARGEDVPLV